MSIVAPQSLKVALLVSGQQPTISKQKCVNVVYVCKCGVNDRTELEAESLVQAENLGHSEMGEEAE